MQCPLSPVQNTEHPSRTFMSCASPGQAASVWSLSSISLLLVFLYSREWSNECGLITLDNAAQWNDTGINCLVSPGLIRCGSPRVRNVGGNCETITGPGPAQGNDGNVGLMSGDTGPIQCSLHTRAPMPELGISHNYGG